MPVEDVILQDLNTFFENFEKQIKQSDIDSDSNMSGITSQDSKSEQTIQDLKNQLLDKAKKISELKFEKILASKRHKKISEKIPQLNNLIDKIKGFQSSIYNKNKEMMELIDDFNRVIIELVDVYSKINFDIESNVTRSRRYGGKRNKRRQTKKMRKSRK